MFRRDFRSFIIFTFAVAGLAASFVARADDHAVLRSNRLAYAIGRENLDAPRKASYVTDQSPDAVARANPDAGTPLTNTVPFTLPFTASAVAFNPVRPVAYAVDGAGRRLVSMDMGTGRTIRSYSLDYTPVSMTITPDGRWLYVAQRIAPATWPGTNEVRGIVSEFDLVSGVKTGMFPVSFAPGRMVASDSRQIVVLPDFVESGAVYDAPSGNCLWTFEARDWANLVLAPAQDSFYVFQAGSARQFAMAPGTNGTGVVLKSGQVDASSWFLISPDGTRAIGNLGGVFDLTGERIVAAPGQFLDLRTTYHTGLWDGSQRPALLMVQAGPPPRLFLFNTRTLNMAQMISLPTLPTLLERSGDRVFYALYGSPGVTGTVFGEFENPALGMETNRPPTMTARIVPDRILARRPVTFDASGSTDDQDSLEELSFFWDLDGDGIIETGGTNQAIFTGTYPTAGNYVVRCEARDRWGEVSRWERVIQVDEEPDAGEAPGFTEAWRLPFEAADVAFDPVRQHLWATDRAGRAVVRVNLTNGVAERRWTFPQPPSKLAVTPDGRFLYAIIGHPLGENAVVTNGYVAEFDLRENLLLRVIGINAAPADIAADGGFLYVATGNAVQSHRAADGGLISRVTVSDASVRSLRISPAYHRLYATAVASWWGFSVLRLDYGSNGFLSGQAQSQMRSGDSIRDFFPLPGDTRLLDSYGGLWINRPGQPDDLQPIQPGTSIGAVADCVEVPGTGEVLLTGGWWTGYYRADSMEPLFRMNLDRYTPYAGAYADRQFLVGVWNNRSFIRQRVRPGAVNVPPQAGWLAPAQGRAFAQGEYVNLEAEADDPDGTVEQVTFYRGSSVMGEARNYRFELIVPDLPLGTNIITAVARDNRGTNSVPATNIVIITRRPTIAWASAQDAAVLDRGADFTLEVTAGDPDGSVRRVDFYEISDGVAVPVGSVTDAPWRFSLTNLTQSRMFLAVATDNHGVSASTPYRWVQLAGATGDDYYRPFELHGESATVRVSNTNATTQRFEQGFFWSPQRSLWWKWTAPSSGVYRLDTFGSDFDTQLGVFEDSADLAALETLAFNDDYPPYAPASGVKFMASRGRTYRIAVDGDPGNVVLSLDLESPLPEVPSNDAFRRRIVMTGDRWETEASNVNAAAEPGEPLHSGILSGPSVWWEWKAPTNGLVEITTAGSDIDTVLAVYFGPTPPTVSILQPVANNDDNPAGGTTSSRVRFIAREGTAYFIAVTGYEGHMGRVRLGLDFTPLSSAPVNDNYTNAVILRGGSGAVDGHNFRATPEPGIPSIFSNSGTVWYRWRAPSDADFFFSVTGTGPDSLYAAVYTSGPGNNFIPVIVEQRSGGPYRFHASAGATYSILLDAQFQYGTAFTLLWSVPNYPSPPVASLSLRPDGIAEIGYEGHVPATAIIMASPDLKTWGPVTTNNFAPGQRIALPVPGDAQKFYKLVFP